MTRNYRQHCGLARALDVVGERWTLLVVRNLLLGPKRFGDLVEGLPGITTNLLSKRLQALVAAGLVERRTLPAPANVPVYALTADGAALEPAIMELARWGGRFMGAPKRGDTVDVGWGLLSMKRRYLGGLTLDAELTVDARVFGLRFEPTYLGVEEGPLRGADLRLRASTAAARALLFVGAPSAERAAELGVEIEGRPGDSARFFAAFGPAPDARGVVTAGRPRAPAA